MDECAGAITLCSVLFEYLISVLTAVSVVVAAQDSRFSDHEWGERSFPYLQLFDRPLGPPKGGAVEVTPRVWHREFEHVRVELRVDCEQLPRNCSTISTKSDDGDLSPRPRASVNATAKMKQQD